MYDNNRDVSTAQDSCASWPERAGAGGRVLGRALDLSGWLLLGGAGVKTVFGKAALADGVLTEADEEELAIIEGHLSNVEKEAGMELKDNRAMMARLRAAFSEGRTISGADANFYLHELREAELVDSGVNREIAHAQVLSEQGTSPFSLYHPDVIRRLGSEWFNEEWFRFWGIEK